MRLINVTTLKLEEFIDGRNVPNYAILSHTWGRDEVLFHDITNFDVTVRQKEGWKKIELTCRQALKHGLQYAWVDTCCIDKTSSAELSEAINSMFALYRDSTVCYVYLKDVYTDSYEGDDLSSLFLASGDDPNIETSGMMDLPDSAEIISQLSTSRWFSRGWTLQELLAPAEVAFFSKNWVHLGRLDNLVEVISTITGITASVLRKEDAVHNFSVACRMSWAAKRETTRIEDEAYCLLGIFGVNMPLLYGEGKAAFFRLQKEIIHASNDLSILAWDRDKAYSWDIGQKYGFPVLANSAAPFARCQSFSPPIRSEIQSTFQVTPRGVEIQGWFLNERKSQFGKKTGYVILSCFNEREPTKLLALEIIAVSDLPNWEECMVKAKSLKSIPFKNLRQKGCSKQVMLVDTWSQQTSKSSEHLLRVRCVFNDTNRYSANILETHPTKSWIGNDLCRPGTTRCAFKIQIDEQLRGGAPVATQIMVAFRLYNHVGDAYVRQVETKSNQSLYELCESTPDSEDGFSLKPEAPREWLPLEIASESRVFAVIGNRLPFQIDRYYVRVAYVRNPSGDAYPQLVLLINRRIGLLRTLGHGPNILLSGKAAKFAGNCKSLTNRSPSSGIHAETHVYGASAYETQSLTNLVADHRSRYGTRLERFTLLLSDGMVYSLDRVLPAPLPEAILDVINETWNHTFGRHKWRRRATLSSVPSLLPLLPLPQISPPRMIP